MQLHSSLVLDVSQLGFAATAKMFSPAGCRVVVVSGVPDFLPVDRMIDKMTIHFQSSRSHGGDVEGIKYPTELNGVAFVTFEKAKDAEKVVQKEHQIMTDKEFPEDYHLTVFPFTPDMFVYVTDATINLSVFSDAQDSLIQSLRSTHRSVRIQPLPQERRATVEGPFKAIKALKEDLISRASRATDGDRRPVSAQTAAVQQRRISRNPVLTSRHERVGALNYAIANTESSSSPAKSLQYTGDAVEEQSLFLHENKEQFVTGPKPHHKDVNSSSIYCTNSDAGEEQTAPSSLNNSFSSIAGPSKMIASDTAGPSQIDTGHATEQAKTHRGKAEMNTGTRFIAEGILSTQTGLEHISGLQIREDNIPGHYEVSASHVNGSAVRAKQVHTNQKGRLESTATDGEDMKGPSQIGTRKMARPSQGSTEALEEETLWVDANTFRYIQRIDTRKLSRCLRGRDVTLRYEEGTDVTWISLSGAQTTQGPSEVQRASEQLKTLVESWQATLRVHSIDLERNGLPGKQRLLQICKDTNVLHDDVVCMVEDSSIKVIGPPSSSHLFCDRVKDRITDLKDTYL